MAASDLLDELRATFLERQTTGTFDATRVQGGAYVALLTGLGVPTLLALTSAQGWQSDGTNITLTGSCSTSVLGVSNAAVFFRFTPNGTAWVLVLDVALPATWTFGQSFPLLVDGVFADLKLAASQAALVIASGAGTDTQRLVGAAPGTPLPVQAGMTFYGTFDVNSSAISRIAWLLDGGALPLTTGAIAYDAGSGAVTMRLPLATGSIDDLFGASGPKIVLQLALYSGLDVALNQYEFGVCLTTTISFNSTNDVVLSALFRHADQPILDIGIAGTALAFPSAATLEKYFGAQNGITEALPSDFQNTSLVEISAITFGLGLRSEALEYAFLSMDALPGKTWNILPGAIELRDVNFLFSVFSPMTAPDPAFTFSAVFVLGDPTTGIPLLIRAELPGEVLSGELDPTLPDPSLVPLIQDIFHFTNGLPEELVIGKLDFQADIANAQYSADLEITGDWTFSIGPNTDIIFEDLSLSFTYDQGASGSVCASFAINSDNQFQVELDMTPDNKKFIGTWVDTGAPLTFRDIAIALGMYGLPDLPDGLELGITAAGFEFDSAGPSFSFDIDTVLYQGDDPSAGSSASAALVAGKDTTGAHWGFLYGMVAGLNLKLNLTDIPLVGNLVPAGDAVIAVQDMRLIAATKVLPVYTPNAKLTTIFGDVVNSGLVLTVDLQVGTLSEAISVRFGGSDDGTASDQPAQAACDTTRLPATVPIATPPQTASAGQQASWVNVQRAFGPVQINRVGFTITTDSKVGILLDAAVSLGGLRIGLTGLKADVPIQSPFTPSFALAGLQVQYDAAVFRIGGGLAKTPGKTPAEYTGELLLEMETFGATALGSYTTIAGNSSLFAFLFLDDPLGGPPPFFVTGLAGGFGYNRSLQLPSVADVAGYPLVQGAMGTLNADQTQAELETYIQPEGNETWFAAGVRFTSFEMVQSFALLTVAFGTNVEIALMGQSTLTVPVSTVEKPQEPVAEADLLVLVDVQVTNGVVAANAQLAPSSYVFSRAAQLTGGFAFYLWFGRSPYAGDFVLTLGGYNPYFSAPSYYPQVPQLGLNWQVSGELTVKGGLYFTITPSVVMAGGQLSATWQSGGISAWFDAKADFLIRYKPFTYEIDVSVSIGFTVTIDLWVTSFTVTVHVGVDLTMCGPPFQGVAHIDLSIASFTIAFGSSTPPDNNNILWPEFRDSFLPQPGASKTPAPPRPPRTANDAATRTKSLITISAPTGIVRTFAKDGGTAWAVNAGTLQLAVATLVPTTVLTLPAEVQLANGTAWVTQLGVGPMGAGAGALVSTLKIDIQRDGSPDADDWTAVRSLGSVPVGLWLNTAGQMQTDGTLAGVLVGLVLRPTPPGGESTMPVPIEELLADNPPICHFGWTATAPPQGESFDQKTAMAKMQSSLVDITVGARRGDILTALTKQGAKTVSSVHVGNFAQHAPNLLLAPPLLQYLGEVPKP